MKYINKRAFDRGFKDFKEGNIFDAPYSFGSMNYKEWIRGQNYAFYIMLNRAKQREKYRSNLT